MGNFKFGRKQIGNPTPSGVNFWVRVFTVVATFFVGWMGTNTIIGPHTQAGISSILGGMVGLANLLAPLFGVPISGSVPASVVTAIEKP